MSNNDLQQVMLASRRQELHNLTKLLEEIERGFPWMGEICLAHQVQGCSKQNSAGLDIETCLEIIFNRVYVLLNVFVIYLENNSKKQLEVGRNIVKPKSLTLTGIARMLWLKLIGWSSNKVEHTLVEEKNPDIRPNAQIGNKYCDSCLVAIKTIKTLISKFHWNQSACSIARDNAHANIFNVQQIDAMIDLCQAICSDVDFLIQENVTIKEVSATIEHQLEIIRKEYEVLQSDHKYCSIRHGKLLHERNKYNQDNTDLQLMINELKQQLLHIETAKTAQLEEIGNLQIENTKNLDLIKDYTKIQTELTCCSNNLEVLEKNISTSKRDVKDKLQRFEKQLGELQEQVEAKMRLQQITIERLQDELQMCKPQLLKVIGDPVDDMMHQIEDNNRSILKLEKENGSLMKTLIRMRELN